jgi:hypothetical protein
MLKFSIKSLIENPQTGDDEHQISAHKHTTLRASFPSSSSPATSSCSSLSSSSSSSVFSNKCPPISAFETFISSVNNENSAKVNNGNYLSSPLATLSATSELDDHFKSIELFKKNRINASKGNGQMENNPCKLNTQIGEGLQTNFSKRKCTSPGAFRLTENRTVIESHRHQQNSASMPIRSCKARREQILNNAGSQWIKAATAMASSDESSTSASSSLCSSSTSSFSGSLGQHSCLNMMSTPSTELSSCSVNTGFSYIPEQEKIQQSFQSENYLRLQSFNNLQPQQYQQPNASKALQSQLYQQYATMLMCNQKLGAAALPGSSQASYESYAATAAAAAAAAAASASQSNGLVNWLLLQALMMNGVSSSHASQPPTLLQNQAIRMQTFVENVPFDTLTASKSIRLENNAKLANSSAATSSMLSSLANLPTLAAKPRNNAIQLNQNVTNMMGVEDTNTRRLKTAKTTKRDYSVKKSTTSCKRNNVDQIDSTLKHEINAERKLLHDYKSVGNESGDLKRALDEINVENEKKVKSLKKEEEKIENEIDQDRKKRKQPLQQTLEMEGVSATGEASVVNGLNVSNSSSSSINNNSNNSTNNNNNKPKNYPCPQCGKVRIY